MSVIIKSKSSSIELTDMSFVRLQRKIAYSYNEELGQIFDEFLNCETEEDYALYRNHNATFFTKELMNNKSPLWLIDFLFTQDFEGILEYNECLKLLKIIVYCKDDMILGHFSDRNCATLKDFKQLLQVAHFNKQKILWCNKDKIISTNLGF